jgi:hypothetical protein
MQPVEHMLLCQLQLHCQLVILCKSISTAERQLCALIAAPVLMDISRGAYLEEAVCDVPSARGWPIPAVCRLGMAAMIYRGYPLTVSTVAFP